MDTLVDMLQVRCLSAVANTIIHDLAVYLVCSDIDECHIPSNRGRADQWYPQQKSGTAS